MATTLTKADLALVLNQKVGLNRLQSKEMVQAFFDELVAALEGGDSVKFSGFGNFSLRDKSQRPGRNPKTGEVMPVSARRVVTFHASSVLRDAVEDAGVVEEGKARKAA